MRRFSFVLLAMLPLAANAQNAKPRTSAEQSLIDINSRLNAALSTGDTAALSPLLAGDLVFTDPWGAAQSRAQLLSAVAGGFRVRAAAAEVTRVHIDGNIGLLDSQSKVATSGGDSLTVQSTAVYVLRGGHWQLTSLHSTGTPAQPRRPTPIAVPLTPVLRPPTRPMDATPTLIIDRPMTTRATGTFQVETKPLTPYNTSAAGVLGRFSLDKQYHGEIEGTGKGEMLSAGNAASGSAGYVAVEYVTATLRGKKGSFALQHFGTMDKGALSLKVSVVPGSGTGELAGISGTMNIIAEKGKHSYVFDYSLPTSQ
jgi:ketosteroid isomerase-like protein